MEMHASSMEHLACKGGESVSRLMHSLDEVLFCSWTFFVGMEDAHTTIPEYKDTGASFFAVFDGHGGTYYYLGSGVCVCVCHS